MKPETFTLDLGDGTRCTARIDSAWLGTLTPKTLPSVVAIEWEGHRRDAHFIRYREWIASVWQRVADLSNKSLCTVLSGPNQIFLITCQPQSSPVIQPLAHRP